MKHLFALLWFGALAVAAEPTLHELPAPQIPARDFNVTDFGAKGDGVTVNTAAIRAAFQACAKSGGGRVLVPEGIFVSGPLELTSHTALVLAKGAILQASGKFSDFGLSEPLPSTQSEIDVYRKVLSPFLTGTKLEDVEISGEGIIDGAGAGWWAKSDKLAERAVAAANQAGTPIEKPLYVPRPHLVLLRDCARVRVQGVTMRNSPMFHLVPHHCHDVLVEDVTIFSPADAPNTDGIDPANSHDVLIRRCTIDTGDDDIALKGGGVGGEATENVIVTDCKILHGHGISIGSETEAGVRGFLVQNCSFENTGTALRIKSGRTRGGVVENATYRDITMKNVEAAITVSLFYDDQKAALKPEWKEATETTPKFQNILFQNITCEGATKKAGEITGLPESPVTGVTLEHVHIKGAAAPFAQQDTKGLRMLDVDVQSVGASGAKPASRITVAADGTGEFRTIQEAVDHAAGQPNTIFIRKGEYHELVRIGKDKPRVHLLGEDRKGTLLSYTNNEKLNPGWSQRAVLAVEGDDFSLENLTVQNTTPYKGSQAEAVFINAERCTLRKADFLSFQDTLNLSGRVYVADCYIEGDVDYVWGYGTAYFDRCELRTMHDGYLVQARNPPGRAGYVFRDCRFTAVPEVKKLWLARIETARFPASHVTLLHCALGAHIRPEGWQLTGPPCDTLRFGEFASTDLDGKPLDVSHRDPVGKQLTAGQAAALQPAAVLGGGDAWNPAGPGK